MTGECKEHRNCHIEPHLALIDQKPDIVILRLVRIGSHSKLGL
ncbi:type II toxin-antitoxin system YafQ family toxin [Actimicrobium antarcticum]